MKFAVIGLGRFGINYLKTLTSLDQKISWVCAISDDEINKTFDKVKLASQPNKTINYKDILEDEGVEAVAVVTPGSTHYQIVKDSLLANKNVIVEKPFVLSSKEAEDLVDLAKKQNKKLMVGHLHLFNPGISKLKQDIDAGVFGKINYFQFIQAGNGPIRSDSGALWDFMPHPVSILLYLLGKYPEKICANGASFIKKGNEDVISLNLAFEDNIFATCFGSWLYPEKIMKFVAVGEKQYAIFDDYSESKLKYVSKDNKVEIQQLEMKFPLTEQLKYFIESDKIQINSGDDALKVTKILDKAEKSFKN